MSTKNLIALAAAFLMSSLAGANAQGYGLMPLTLDQSAVINGGITSTGPMVGGNLLGTTKLPAGTELVSGAGGTAIILPGMVGMPQLSGCNVAIIGNTEPSALSLIGTSNFVASLPVGGSPPVGSRTFQRVIQHHTVRRIHRRTCQRRIIHRQCSHRRVFRREILK